MITLTLTPHSNIRVEAGETRVVLTATDAQAVAILHLTPAQALALCSALCDAVEPLTKGDAE